MFEVEDELYSTSDAATLAYHWGLQECTVKIVPRKVATLVKVMARGNVWFLRYRLLSGDEHNSCPLNTDGKEMVRLQDFKDLLFLDFVSTDGAMLHPATDVTEIVDSNGESNLAKTD